MGHAHCTSGASTCSEIPHSLTWSRKAPSIHDMPRGGTVQVLTNRDVKPSGRVLRLCPAFCLREARWWLQLEVRKTSNLHYTTALHTISPVFSHHTTVLIFSLLSRLEQIGVGCRINGHLVGALVMTMTFHWLRQVGQVYVLLSMFVNNLHLTMT